MLPAARQIASTRGGSFVVRFAIPYCDEEVQTLFEEELARGDDNHVAKRWQ